MFVQRERPPSAISSKCLLLGISIIAFVLCSLCVCSFLETKYRLDTITHQHQLLINEIKTILGFEAGASKRSLSGHQSEKQFHLVYLASNEKLITTKDEANQAIEMNAYLDQSGRSDYALASAGARIMSIGQTQLVNPPTQWSAVFGGNNPIDSSNGPHHVLEPSIFPGECFAFIGRGEIRIKLVRPVYIDAVSIEHILPQMSPDSNIRNAPRDFSVYGFVNPDDVNTIHFGLFRYDIDKKRPLQLFPLGQNVTGQRFGSVRFEFLSNHGATNTCVYRIRVYGSLNLTN